MIYTLTLNPSVDYITSLNQFNVGHLNRVEEGTKLPGGKGINVSRLLKRMGVTSVALGYVGGFTGKYIETYLQGEQINTDFVHVNDDTRINVKIKAAEETELNGKGPNIAEEEMDLLKRKISALTEEDLLVIAGSIPASMPASTYEEIVKILAGNGTSFVVDAEGELLRKVLPYRPFLIKPNHHELGQLFETEITSAEQAILYGRQLLEMGAQHVIVSMAGDGAIFISENEVYTSNVPNGEVKSSVGAGDSMVAGFLAQYEKTKNIEKAFQYSVASGSATAFSIGLATEEKIQQLLDEVNIRKGNGAN
ncbi:MULTISPECIES: 1-phosphofructokinase [Bacillaceae]|uniref:1-phosphofructokinase n=1 Tax=Bacillus mesophilum TaxID=1071718 RepID=A0A7V7RMI8_9BACI|nr:1-phosphofructokinase [Bacillus mesophilum]KAB2333493.1 1-phosphofructokinase [Bacillus mesophilum]